MRIVFMGTPEYSVPTIDNLIKAGHEVVAVFAQPDKPVGRKQVLTPPATKVFANAKNIPVYQPQTLRDGQALEALSELAPDLIVVVAYGKILPKSILTLPKFGAINGHASLLPKFRGASPIQWAIVSGETETGVTVMQMDEGMDTGDIIDTVKIEIFPDETAGELFDRLSLITADIIVKTVNEIELGNVNPVKQNNSLATYAPIINKEMAHLDFSKTAYELNNLVRGFNPWPVAFCFIGGKRIKVFSAKPLNDAKAEPGKIVLKTDRLIIGCGGGTALELLTVQPEGGKKMSCADMLRGIKLTEDTVIK